MMKRICPVCDQVMKLPNYCTNCKSWVKYPYIRDVTYYLNESHPRNENDCEYHKNGQTEHGYENIQSVMSRKIQDVSQPLHTRTQSSNARTQTSSTVSRQSDKAHPKTKPQTSVIWIVVAIWIVVKIVGAISEFIFDIF